MDKEVTTQHKTDTELIERFYQNEEQILNGDPDYIAKMRRDAIESFEKAGIPRHPMESWRNTDLDPALDVDYKHELKRDQRKINIHDIFQCQVHNFETYLVSQLNGYYAFTDSPIRELENGVIIGSLREAFHQYPDIVKKHLNQYAKTDSNGLIPLNMAFAQDGLFIYVPENVHVEMPIQMVNLTKSVEKIMMFPRNLVVMEESSKMTLVHCDDSIEQKESFTNAVSEIFMAQNSEMDYYKLQNKDDKAVMVNSTYFHQEDNSKLSTNTISLNGGILRNDIDVTLNGQNCHADILGLYLMDRKQHVDNQVYVDHAQPNSYSNELFKGIIDDEAKAVFNGHIMVRKDSQQTNAFQSNQNIQLTEQARVIAKPFLEIYADDVKCSHGATVGQIDSEAMFYLRSRGICQHNARMLMMYAFAAQVVNYIQIDALKERIDNMVAKRLKGELSICDQCVLHCKDDREITFDVDMSNI